MTDREALKKIARLQGTLLKVVAQLESCKILLYPKEDRK
jgi:hypothetical protein